MRNLIIILLIVPILFGYALSKHQVDKRVHERLDHTDIRYLPSPRTAEFLAFGFKEALADIYWLEAINYFGEQLLKKERDYKYLESYLELIFHLDPKFTAFYDWAATVFIYNALPINRDGVIKAIRYANKGIQMLHETGRYDATLIRKAAFNYALEAQQPVYALPYFELVGRSFSNERDMLLVGSTYANLVGEADKANRLKEEYLGLKMYEVQDRAEIQEALVILSSPSFNSQAADFVRSLRVQVEIDEDVKKLVEKRVEQNPLLQKAMLEKNEFHVNEKIRRLLAVDIGKNWLPPAMHLLLDL